MLLSEERKEQKMKHKRMQMEKKEQKEKKMEEKITKVHDHKDLDYVEHPPTHTPNYLW